MALENAIEFLMLQARCRSVLSPGRMLTRKTGTLATRRAAISNLSEMAGIDVPAIK